MRLSFGNLIDLGPDAGDPRRGTFPTGSSAVPRTTGFVLGTPVSNSPSTDIYDDGILRAARNQRAPSTSSRSRTTVAPSGFGLGIPVLPTRSTAGGFLAGLLGDGISASDFTIGTPATEPLPAVPSFNLGTLAPNIVRSSPIADIPTASTVELDGGTDFLGTLRDLAGEAIAGIAGRDRRASGAEVIPASFGGGGSTIGGLSTPMVLALMVAAGGAFYLLSGE